LLGNFPQANQAYAIGVDYSPETLVIGAPAQIRPRIDGSCDCLPKKVWPPKSQDTSQGAQ
jgi:hypothetical protein